MRITIWRLMIAIAIIGLPLGLIAEQERQRGLSESLRSLAAYHEASMVASVACSRTRCTFTDRSGKIMTSDEVKLNDWHQRLAEKYRQTAACPWLPIESDAPPDLRNP